MPALLSPQPGDEPGGLVELGQWPMAVHLHPVDRLGVLQDAAVGHAIPVDVHRTRNAGRVLHERVRRSDEHDHRGQRWGTVQCREPLDPARITAAVGRDGSRAPFLGGGPLDHVEAVGAVIAVGLELTVRIASPAHIDPDRDVAGPRERVGAGARAFISTAVWRAHHDRGRRTVGGQHEIRRERDPIAHRDPDVEATRQSFADGWGHELAILADGPPASVARRPRRSAPFRPITGDGGPSSAARWAARSPSGWRSTLPTGVVDTDGSIQIHSGALYSAIRDPVSASTRRFCRRP